MQEILFITNEQRLLEIIDQLKTLVDARIDIVNDFSQGLKEIFFRHPSVVFIQKEIGGLTGEKVASQVRALLDEEPIRLVLLHNETYEWQVADSNFNGSIDISLPPPELIRQLQQQVFEALYPVQGIPAVSEVTLKNDTGKNELSIDPPGSLDDYSIDSLADLFPPQFPDDWGAPLSEADHNAQTTAKTVEPVVEPIKPGEEFTFDNIPDISPDDLGGSDIPFLLPETGEPHPPPWINSLPGQVPAGDNEWREGDVRPDDQEQPPHLSVGMSDETLSGMDLDKFATSGSLRAAQSGVRPEPEPTYTDSSEILRSNGSSSAATTGYSEKSPAMVDQAPPLSYAAQKEEPPVFGGSSSIKSGPAPEHFGADSSGAAFADDITFREDFGKKNSLKLKLFIGALILSIFLAVFFLVRNWLGVPEHDTLAVAPSSSNLPAPVRDLPAFIPEVTVDGAYAAAHPGWERRESDGLEYLIYRENGRIRAIQVIAGTRGVISVPFLKTCIRETTGLENADKWVREKRDDIIVEKGTLNKKGELAVYRKMPEGDIRGFVLSFY